MNIKEHNILKAFNLKNGESLTETLLLDTLKKQGIQRYDPRISGISFGHLFDQNGQTSNRLNTISNDRRIVQKAIQKDNVIPDFECLSHLLIRMTCHKITYEIS